ncbi:MAG: porin, partial [Phyllobacterium sp.]
AVSGARAADAVVIAEPEPVEYVRVCDAYGAGYFYIPGTETCLSIGGLVRYQIGADSEDDALGNNGWRKLLRAEIKINAKSETELGTLGAYIRLRSNTYSGFANPYYADLGLDASGDVVGIPYGGSNSGVFVQDAVISLGGLAMGLSDTLFDDELPNFENEFTGATRIHFMRYTFAGGNGFSATLALEEADFDYDFVPNVVGKVAINQGWGFVNLYGAYDASWEEGAFKAVAGVNVTDAVQLGLIATYETGHSFYSMQNDTAVFGSQFQGYEWSAGASVKFKATDKLAFTVGGQYYGSAHEITVDSGPFAGTYGGGDDWTIGTVVDYNIVQGFDTKLAVNYSDGDNYDDGVVHGFLRFDRSF